MFYKQEDEYKEVQRVQIYRALSLLMSSIAGDVFQHWIMRVQTIHQKNVIRNTPNYAKDINIQQSTLQD